MRKVCVGLVAVVAFALCVAAAAALPPAGAYQGTTSQNQPITLRVDAAGMVRIPTSGHTFTCSDGRTFSGTGAFGVGAEGTPAQIQPDNTFSITDPDTRNTIQGRFTITPGQATTVSGTFDWTITDGSATCRTGAVTWSARGPDSPAAPPPPPPPPPPPAPPAVPKIKLKVDLNGTGLVSVAPRSGGGSCQSVCTFVYARGTRVTLTAKPDPARITSQWRGACGDKSPQCTFTLRQATAVGISFVERAAMNHALQAQRALAGKSQQYLAELQKFLAEPLFEFEAPSAGTMTVAQAALAPSKGILDLLQKPKFIPTNGGYNLQLGSGAVLAGRNGGPLVPDRLGMLIGPDGATLIGSDGATLIGPDGATLIGSDGATLIGPDGATLIGPDGATLRALRLPQGTGRHEVIRRKVGFAKVTSGTARAKGKGTVKVRAKAVGKAQAQRLLAIGRAYRSKTKKQASTLTLVVVSFKGPSGRPLTFVQAVRTKL